MSDPLDRRLFYCLLVVASYQLIVPVLLIPVAPSFPVFFYFLYGLQAFMALLLLFLFLPRRNVFAKGFAAMFFVYTLSLFLFSVLALLSL
jgi:hypothetical protein